MTVEFEVEGGVARWISLMGVVWSHRWGLARSHRHQECNGVSIEIGGDRGCVDVGGEKKFESGS